MVEIFSIYCELTKYLLFTVEFNTLACRAQQRLYIYCEQGLQTFYFGKKIIIFLNFKNLLLAETKLKTLKSSNLFINI